MNGSRRSDRLMRARRLLKVFCTVALALPVAMLFLLSGPMVEGATERVTVDPDVQRAVSGGSARVLVELRVPSMRPEGQLTPEAVRAQRQAIATASHTVLARLAGSRFSLVREYETVPLLVLTIHDDALRGLENMADAVVRVRLDGPVPSAAPGTGR